MIEKDLWVEHLRFSERANSLLSASNRIRCLRLCLGGVIKQVGEVSVMAWAGLHIETARGLCEEFPGLMFFGWGGKTIGKKSDASQA